MEAKVGEIALKTEEVTSKVTEKEEQEKLKKVSTEDEIPTPDPIIQEEPFLKAIKSLSGKALEGVSFPIGKMEPEKVWI